MEDGGYEANYVWLVQTYVATQIQVTLECITTHRNEWFDVRDCGRSFTGVIADLQK